MSKLASLIWNARRRSGLTLRAVEKMSGVSRSEIWQIETGATARPGFIAMVKLCDALDVSYDSAADAARKS